MERRKFVRKFAKSPIQLFDLERNLICEVDINNISEGGVLVVSEGPENFNSFDPKERIRFKLRIPTGEVAGIAEVVWKSSEESCMGLKFTNIENECGASNLMAFMTNELM